MSVFTVGEMLMGDPFRWATDYIAHWVKDGAIGSAFNYPMVSTLRRTLRVSGAAAPAVCLWNDVIPWPQLSPGWSSGCRYDRPS